MYPPSLRHATLTLTVVVGAFFLARGSMDLVAAHLLRQLRPVVPGVATAARLGPAIPKVPVRALTSVAPRGPAAPQDRPACPAGLRLVGALQTGTQADSIALVREGDRVHLVHGDEDTRWGTATVAPYALELAGGSGETCQAVLTWAPR